MTAQEEAQQLDRTPLFSAIIQFHQQKVFMLECLRLILKESFEVEREIIRDLMLETVALILQADGGAFGKGSLFARKCLTSMEDTERWLSLLNEQVQKASIVGQTEDADVMEAIQYQSASLMQQHESLGVILYYLFKGNYTNSEDLRLLLDRLQKLERFDNLMVDYIPAIVASFIRYGSPEGSLREARRLHYIVTTSKESQSWALPNFHAAVIAIWLSIYSAWYFDSGSASPLQGIDLDKETEERSKMFMAALDDGALEFMLAICAGISSDEWRDPARSELVTLLLKESASSILEPESRADFFKPLLMEQFDVFTESCIANMPDAVRMLKSEEDLQRLNQITALRDGLTSTIHRGVVEARTHLESFLMIMAFAFEHRYDAAQEFWADHDGNLYGFLQWASKRQTVPRVSAFCEMLCSISEGEDNAISTHRFLSEEDKYTTTKFRRSSSMNWTQMFAELQLYASKVVEKPSTSQAVLNTRKLQPIDMNEPESPVMLTCYLRLMGHLSEQSSTIREWLLHHASFNVVDTLLTLCSGSIPTHLRASAFGTLKALMTDRSFGNGKEMWLSIDQWISGTAIGAPGLAKVPMLSNPPSWHKRHAFQRIGESFDQTNAFVELIHALILPSRDTADIQFSLPFPESLGVSYRMPGIEPYIDFILGHAFAKKTPDATESQGRLLTCNCLRFAATCLSTFNEKLVTIACQPSITSDSTIKSSSLGTYSRLHPFSRVAEWLFNEDVLKALFLASHQDISEVSRAQDQSVLVLSLETSIHVMNLILDHQSTYLNVTRPLVRSQAAANRMNVANSSLASFEDSILNNLSIIKDLCLYCGTGHENLTIVSMELLEKLSSSKKLNKTQSPEVLSWVSPNKVVEVFSKSIEADQVARPLASQMHPDLREIEYGPHSTGYRTRERLLRLLNSCLGMITDRPTIAHLLLGFSYVGVTLDIAPQSLFANRMSLLHAIIDFMHFYPTEINGVITSWTVHLKRLAFEVLKHLWSSKLSSSLTLIELRMSRFLLTSFASQPVIGLNTEWDGLPVSHPDFWRSESAVSLSEFLAYRSYLFNYAVTEIRSASKHGSSTLQTSILSTLLGTSSIDTGVPIANPSVFDLFDFADLDTFVEFNPPTLNFLRSVNFQLCAQHHAGSPAMVYDLDDVQQLVKMRKNELFQSGQLRPQEEEQFQTEFDGLMIFLKGTNQCQEVRHNHHLAMKAWTELIIAIISFCDINGAHQTTFILQAIQIILPKLEISIFQNAPEAIELGRLAETLISKLDLSPDTPHSNRSGDIIDEKLYQLFEISVRSIILASDNIPLRECLYHVCSQYLSRITSSGPMHNTLRHHSQSTVRTAGIPLIEMICDDAYAGQENCRVSALLLLNLLAALDSQENSSLLADAILETNYLSMFLDAVTALPTELRNTQASGAYFQPEPE